MSTAALMQCPGDPFIFAYWARNCERVWRQDVDEVHVFVNGQEDEMALDLIRDECARIDAAFSWQEGRLVHGDALGMLLASCRTDAVVLLEDDAFVRESGAIGRSLRRVLSGETDVVGTPRGGMSPEIEVYARQVFEAENLTSPNGADNGPGLWPCFLFARTDVLMSTSRQFASRSWRTGEKIPGIDYLVPQDGMTTDTFTTTAFELRGPRALGGLGLQIEPCVQHKELWDKDLPDAWATPWFHAGGLSNGDFLGGAFGPMCGGGARPDLGGSNEGNDWAHRVWWWRRCLDTAGSALADRQEEYREGLDMLEDYLGVHDEVWAWGAKLEPWISWNDQP